MTQRGGGAPPASPEAREFANADELPTIYEGDFMYMAYVSEPSTALHIHLYKHIHTRRYLNLDDGGHAYRFCGPLDEDDRKSGGLYALLPTLAAALHLVVDDLSWMRPPCADQRAWQ